MHSSLVGLLTGGLSGQTLNHSDIGGYVSACFRPFVCIKRTEEILIHWMEMNAFGIVFRTHVGLPVSLISRFFYKSSGVCEMGETFKTLKDYKKPFLEDASTREIPSWFSLSVFQ